MTLQGQFDRRFDNKCVIAKYDYLRARITLQYLVQLLGYWRIHDNPGSLTFGAMSAPSEKIRTLSEV